MLNPKMGAGFLPSRPGDPLAKQKAQAEALRKGKTPPRRTKSGEVPAVQVAEGKEE